MYSSNIAIFDDDCFKSRRERRNMRRINKSISNNSAQSAKCELSRNSLSVFFHKWFLNDAANFHLSQQPCPQIIHLVENYGSCGRKHAAKKCLIECGSQFVDFCWLWKFILQQRWCSKYDTKKDGEHGKLVHITRTRKLSTQDRWMKLKLVRKTEKERIGWEKIVKSVYKTEKYRGSIDILHVCFTWIYETDKKASACRMNLNGMQTLL